MLGAQGIRKRYGGVTALDGVDFTARSGSVHALLGENGAGKSTLVKTLAGAQAPDAGALRLDGRELELRSTADATAQGIAVVSQELSVFPDLDVLSNLFPMREPRRGLLISRRAMARVAEPVLHDMGLDVGLETPVGELSLEQRQLVEIARAVVSGPRILILDEPTSALHADGTARLHEVLRGLRDRDVGIVYVSHILEDVLEICDEVTVLRDGRTVVDGQPAAGMTIDVIVRAMLGDKVLAAVAEATPRGADDAAGTRPCLRMTGVSVDGELDDVSLEVEAGTVVGLAGVAGAGHRTALAALVGLVQPDAGSIELPGGEPLGRGMRQAIRQGVALVSGDRRRFGVMLDKSIAENVGQVCSVALSRDGLFVRSSRMRERAREHASRLGIKASSVEQEVGTLSGGNQQKVVFAKWLAAEPSVLLLDDPTRGIDVGAKAEIYGLMRELADRGTVQVLVSEDPLELAAICDSVVVFHEGRVCARLERPDVSAHTILEVMNTGAVA